MRVTLHKIDQLLVLVNDRRVKLGQLPIKHRQKGQAHALYTEFMEGVEPMQYLGGLDARQVYTILRAMLEFMV